MKIKKMKIYNTIHNSRTVMHFLVQNLKIKNGEQLKHRNIMNEILWIYGIYIHTYIYVCLYECTLYAIPAPYSRMADKSEHPLTDAQANVLEDITRKVSIKKAKEMTDATQKEYILEQMKSKAQEDTIRKVNQMKVDKAMDVSGEGGREGGREG